MQFMLISYVRSYSTALLKLDTHMHVCLLLRLGIFISSFASWLQVHDGVLDNPWHTTLVRHAKLFE